MGYWIIIILDRDDYFLEEIIAIDSVEEDLLLNRKQVMYVIHLRDCATIGVSNLLVFEEIIEKSMDNFLLVVVVNLNITVVRVD